MILVSIDHADGAPRRTSLELVAAARALAAPGEALAGVVVGGREGTAAAEAIARHLPRVLLVQGDELDRPSHERRTSALAAAARDTGAEVVLLAANRGGQAVGPRLAMRLAGALLEDLTAVRREEGSLVGERLAYLARAGLTVRAEARPAVVSMKPGAFEVAEPAATVGEVVRVEVAPERGDDVAGLGARHAAQRGRVALEEAEAVVCGGRGLGDAESFERHVVGLAADLGAGVASTRAVVDAGWRAFEEQVGQTGKSVSPKLYVALAVSGAVQHVSGMNRSGTVVAVNKDGDAPIFRVADYAVIGDVHEVVPALRAALAALRQR